MREGFAINAFESWLLQWRSLNARWFFVVLCLFQAALVFVEEDVIGFRSDFFDLISTVGDPEARGMLSMMWSLKIALGYLSIPLVYLLKCSGIALLLWMAAFGFGYRISFPFFFKLSLFSQPVFFVSQLIKILWFGFVDMEYNAAEVESFFPLSLYALVKPETAGFWRDFTIWLSLPQFGYWYLLATGIRLKYYRTLRQGFWVVFAGYILFALLALWFSSVVFA